MELIQTILTNVIVVAVALIPLGLLGVLLVVAVNVTNKILNKEWKKPAIFSKRNRTIAIPVEHFEYYIDTEVNRTSNRITILCAKPKEWQEEIQRLLAEAEEVVKTLELIADNKEVTRTATLAKARLKATRSHWEYLKLQEELKERAESEEWNSKQEPLESQEDTHSTTNG